MVWVVVDLVDSMYIQMYIAFDCMRLCYILEIILLLDSQRFYLHDNDMQSNARERKGEHMIAYATLTMVLYIIYNLPQSVHQSKHQNYTVSTFVYQFSKYHDVCIVVRNILPFHNIHFLKGVDYH